MARATQRPGQSKEQTKLIAQGIQKGIDLYKKQQKEKAREQSKRAKKAAKTETTETQSDSPVESATGCSKLPWILLALSWLGFGGYLLVNILI